MSFQQVLRVVFLLAVATCLSASRVAANVDDNSTSTTRFLEEAASDYQTVLLNAVNKERVARGLPKLCKNRKLQSAAQTHSDNMAKRSFLSHTGSDGSTMSSRIRAAGFRPTAVSENVAAGQATVKGVVSSWMKSTGHRANILRKTTKFLGVANAYSSSSKYKYYWTLDFATGSTEECA